MQFNRDFTFQKASRLAPYLNRLGVSHCYASPLLTSRPGSMHGYDITNHQALNPEIGTEEDFQHFVSMLQEHDGGLILDIVPNHMGIGPDNPWWMDVLENGPASLYADYFDIDWEPITGSMHGKVLLPILGDSYGHILENGEIQLSFEPENGHFWLNYYEHRLPVNPSSYPMMLAHRQDVLATRLGASNPHYQEYLSIIHAFENLPSHIQDDTETRAIRVRECGVARNRLIHLCEQEPQVADFIRENLPDFHTAQSDSTNMNRLHRLMEAQPYRLANWRVASDEINYRRFFDINDLAAVRVEDARVFSDTHALILDLVKKRQVKGLRIDHPDGLFDPTGYFRKLQEEAAQRLGVEMPAESEGSPLLGSDQLPIYLAVEKITAPYEQLPRFWSVHGTTGYEFANSVGGLFVDGNKEKEMTRVYERFIGHKMDYDELIYRCKKLIIRTSLTSEISVLAMQLKRIAEKDWMTRDYTLNRLRDALTEVVACFPIYRTYVTPEGVRDKDREYIDWAIGAAKKRSAAVDITIFDFIQKVLLMAFPDTLHTAEDEALRRQVETFAMKFQQYTGPVMAKGLEDTAFYRYNRLVSLNEVGGEPHHYGTSVTAFHHQNAERFKRTPHALLTTSTHDTKRSEDVRARISVLSEIPDQWQRQLSRWSRMNRSKKTHHGTQELPDRNDEYLLYQTLLGVWPLELALQDPDTWDADAVKAVADRVENYMLKAIREAKAHTSWINQNEEYETAVSRFVHRLTDTRRNNGFLRELGEFLQQLVRPGLLNALSQTVLKLTSPGVPDIYQGTELWDFSLVDPDNRRPVDYAERERLLHAMAEKPFEDSAELLATLEDGRIKLYTLLKILQLRHQQAGLFGFGDYLPLEASGAKASHVVAFTRRIDEQQIVVVVPRLLHSLMAQKQNLQQALPLGASVWKDTRLSIPQGHWQDLFTGQNYQGDIIRLSDLFSQFPIALLIQENR